MKENLKIIPEDLEIFSVGEKDNGDGGDCVNNHGFHGQISVPKAISDLDGALMSSEITICQEFSLSLSLDAKVQRCFYKCNIFPVSGEMHAYSLSTDGRADSSNAVTQSQKLVASGTSAAYSRSISLPSSSTLVSSMKGGRALNGTIAKFDLCVKWARRSMSHQLPPCHTLLKQNSNVPSPRKRTNVNTEANHHEEMAMKENTESKKNSNMTKPTNVRVRPKW